MAQLLTALGYKRIGTAAIMMHFIAWAMRADLTR